MTCESQAEQLGRGGERTPDSGRVRQQPALPEVEQPADVADLANRYSPMRLPWLSSDLLVLVDPVALLTAEHPLRPHAVRIAIGVTGAHDGVAHLAGMLSVKVLPGPLGLDCHLAAVPQCETVLVEAAGGGVGSLLV